MTVKAIIPRHFSICVFAFTQVAIDLEVLWYLTRWDPPVHRFWHTYLGATVVAAVCFLLGKPVSQLVKTVWNRLAERCKDADLSVPVPTTWLASFTGSVFGAYSHILLDSIFHRDMAPMQPWNPIFGIIGRMLLQVLCVLLGVAGLAVYLERARRKGKANKSAKASR